MHHLTCSEVWGGIKDTDLDICSAGMTISLYSAACDGGKGGDVYYVTVCGQDKLTRLVLADVAGHGQQVSQISQWVYDQMSRRMDDPDQSALMSGLNDRVAAKGYGAITTVALVSYYLHNRHMYYCYAGHPPMLSPDASGRWSEVALPVGTGLANIPLGVEHDVAYDLGDATFAKGARLFLFSDGLLEAPDVNGELFGKERLQATLEEAGSSGPMELKTHVLSRLRKWTGGTLEHDDVTLIAIQLE